MRSNSRQRQRIVNQCEKVLRLAAELSDREERFGSALRELRRLMSSAGAPRDVLEPSTLSAFATKLRPPPAGELTSRILAFLAMNAGESFRTQAVAEALNVPHRTKAVYMNLFRLSNRGQIRRTEGGFAALAERSPQAAARLG
jgi:hypothetical protein